MDQDWEHNPPRYPSPLVHRLAYNGDVVAIKMGRRSGSCRTRGGRISESIRNRRATPPPAHFHRNPSGRGQLAVFLRCSLLTYRFRYARRSRLQKQPTDPAAAGRKPCYLWDRTLASAERAAVSLSPFRTITLSYTELTSPISSSRAIPSAAGKAEVAAKPRGGRSPG